MTIEQRFERKQEIDTMKSYQESKDAVSKAKAEFPSIFGLVAYPGEIFRISDSSSYLNDAGVVMLYTEIKKRGAWHSFCKGSPSELRTQVRKLKMSVAESREEQ
jgi:hypothetical protein